jgi:hypothetical protein
MESPSYTPEIAREICDRLAEGETLRAICRSDHMPSASTVRRWVIDDFEGFAAQYARARDCGLDEMADELIEISDDGTNDTYCDEEGKEKTDADVLGRSKLRVDSRKWYLSKLAPKRYGERTTIAGDPDAPLTAPADPVQAALTLASILAAARQRRLDDGSDLA